MARQAVSQLLTTVSVLLGGISGGEARNLAPHYPTLLGTFDRCRSMLGAIRLLLAHNLSHEAVLLARPLFNDSLMLAEFASSDEPRRAELYIGWALHGIADLERLAFAARARGDDPTDELKALNRRRGELEDYARRKGVGTKQWKPDGDIKSLAEKHGRGDEYIDLLLTHHFVHGSTLAAEQRFTVRDGNEVEVGGPHARLDEWADGTGLFAATSALFAGRSACTIFGWSEPPAVALLLEQAAKLGAELPPVP